MREWIDMRQVIYIAWDMAQMANDEEREVLLEAESFRALTPNGAMQLPSSDARNRNNTLTQKSPNRPKAFTINPQTNSYSRKWYVKDQSHEND